MQHGEEIDMPRREDLRSILVLGSGPIVIGQACEFDYSGTQACRVLRREGYRVVLVNCRLLGGKRRCHGCPHR